jgi:hypothetical protein
VDLFFQVTDPRLRPGERVSVTIPLANAEAGHGLSVPLSAIVRDMNGGSWIYERTDSLTFVRRRVEIASVKDGHALVARGVRSGIAVVIAGAAELFGTEFGAGH